MCESETSKLTEVQGQAVREELQRLLESVTFRTSKRCREFLEYIVEHTIRGPAGTLKERSIGVELFQLPQDFDTGQRTIVRVTANEVRKKLAQHYLAENGSTHRVKIDLPPGSYSAEFTWSTPVETPVAPQPVAPEPIAPPPVVEPALAGWSKRVLLACAALALLVATALSWWRWHAVTPASVDAKSPTVSEAQSKMSTGLNTLRMIAGATSPYVDRSG